MLRNRLLASFITLLLAMLCYAVSDQGIPIADEKADQYFAESIQAAGLAYAGIRGVNAVVSVVKESQIEVAPAGVGVSIAAGQILDPVDDMTERLSTVLVAAIASLGIQKLGYEIGKVMSFKVLAVLLLLAVPLFWLQGRSAKGMLQLVVKLTLILLLLRFILPATAYVSDRIYTHWLAPGIESSVSKLSGISGSYEGMATITPEPDQGFFSSMTSSASEKLAQTRAAMKKLVDNAEQIISALLSLMTAYLAVFVIQVLFLPLSALGLLIAIYRSNFLDTVSARIVRLQQE